LLLVAVFIATQCDQNARARESPKPAAVAPCTVHATEIASISNQPPRTISDPLLGCCIRLC